MRANFPPPHNYDLIINPLIRRWIPTGEDFIIVNSVASIKETDISAALLCRYMLDGFVLWKILDIFCYTVGGK